MENFKIQEKVFMKFNPPTNTFLRWMGAETGLTRASGRVIFHIISFVDIKKIIFEVLVMGFQCSVGDPAWWLHLKVVTAWPLGRVPD